MSGHIDASRIRDAYHVLDTFSSCGRIIARTIHIYVQFGPNYIHTHTRPFDAIHSCSCFIYINFYFIAQFAHRLLHSVIFRCFTIPDSRKLSSSISVGRLCLLVLCAVYCACDVQFEFYSLQCQYVMCDVPFYPFPHT